MLDRLDAIAAHLRQHGSAELRDVVDREYALLDPRSLVGADVQVLRDRYEALPLREVFDDGFENVPPP